MFLISVGHNAARHSDTGSSSALIKGMCGREATASGAEQRGTECHRFREGSSKAYLSTGPEDQDGLRVCAQDKTGE